MITYSYLVEKISITNRLSVQENDQIQVNSLQKENKNKINMSETKSKSKSNTFYSL